VPGRSTKVSEKLVLIPETVEEKEDSDEENEFGISRRDGEHGTSFVTKHETSENSKSV
jgi:hypothetical protein